MLAHSSLAWQISYNSTDFCCLSVLSYWTLRKEGTFVSVLGFLRVFLGDVVGLGLEVHGLLLLREWGELGHDHGQLLLSKAKIGGTNAIGRSGSIDYSHRWLITNQLSVTLG
jgi:hypothetical protein